MKIIIWLLTATLLGVGYNPALLSEAQIKEDHVPVMTTDGEAIPAPETDLYAVNIEAPPQVNESEVFTIKATLTNLEDSPVEILHAAGVFYFVIRDSQGQQVNTFGMHDVGHVGILQAKAAINEQYEYKLDKPGYYEISAIAKFTIGEKKYELETSKVVIEVIS